MPSSYVSWTGDLFHVLILSFLLVLHYYRLNSDEEANYNNKSSTKSKKVKWWKIFSLKHLSYLIIICALSRALLNLSKLVIHEFIADYLNPSVCSYLESINFEFGLISQFCVHLFIAMRSRLSSTDINHPSIWFKIGLLLIFTDLGLIIFPFILRNALKIEYSENNCFVTYINPMLILWILLSDIIIGTYSLSVFVIPLRKHIQYERQISPSPRRKGSANDENNNPEQGHNRNNKSNAIIHDQKSLEQLVIKILIYSTLMIISTIIVATAAYIFNFVHIDNLYILCMS